VIKNVEMKVLLDDIKKLSEVMTEKSNTIRQDLKSLEICIEQTLSRLSVFEGEQQDRARTVLDRAMSVLCSITGQYGLSRKAAQDIADRSCAISRSTGGIVTSVQFHDITRQRFERVKRTLHRLGDKSLSTTDGEVFGAGDGGGADTLAGAADLCACEALEVSSIRDEFVTAVGGIIDNLRSIAFNVLAISADTKKIVGLDGTNKKTFLTEAETLLSLVTESFAALSENGDASKELSKILLSLTDSTAEMARFIGEIEELAEDIELIAFNTEIKSSQIGKEGSSFEIVAESIQRLSAETCTRAKEVSGTLKTITSAAGGLSVSTGRDFGGPSSGMEGISADFERLITTFSRLNGDIVSLFSGIESTGHVLSGDIERIADSIDVHSVVDRGAKKIVSSLKDTALHAGALPWAEKASAPGWAGMVTIRPDRAGGNRVGVGNDGTHDGVELF
jgi:methyl-accepting chemotaxis protein